MADKKETTIEELKALVIEQGETIAKLQAAQGAGAKPKQEAPKPTTPDTAFTVNGKKYKFALPQFILPGKGAVLAKDALNDKALLEKLVLSKSGVIKEA